MKEFEHLKIPLEAIKSATNNFSDDSCIGKGGFGEVYKGEIDHSKGKSVVALKRLNPKFGQGNREFWKEVMMLSFYRHANIVALLGYCDDCGEKIILYEYISKRSLDLYLCEDELTWVRRLKICIGIARGLEYLHSPVGTQLRVFHRDIKSSNVLIDNNWNAKISDFGLSKFCPANQQFTFLISDVVGTYGYCDPLYVESGLLTKESDVYSFGVVLFEVLCGRLSVIYNDTKHFRSLIELVREYYEASKIGELVYNNIKDEISPSSLEVFTEIAYQCLNAERKQRPSMRLIVSALEGALKYQFINSEAEAKAKAKAEAEARAKAEARTEARKRANQGMLKVKVIRTTDVTCVTRVNDLAASNYLIVQISDESSIQKTGVKPVEEDTEWNEKFSLYVTSRSLSHLQIHLINVVSVEKHDFQGYADVSLAGLTPEIPTTFDLRIMDVDNRYIGDLLVEVVFKLFPYDQILPKIEDIIPIPKAPIGTPEGGGLLVVIIRKAKLVDGNYQSASVSLLFRGERRNTLCMMNTNVPVWEQEFEYMLEQPPTNDIMGLKLTTSSRMRLIHHKDHLGYIDINLRDVVYKRRIFKSYLVQPSGGSFANSKFQPCDYVASNLLSSNWLYVELQWRTSSD